MSELAKTLMTPSSGPWRARPVVRSAVAEESIGSRPVSIGGYLDSLLSAGLVLHEDWETLASPKRQEVLRCESPQHLLQVLVENALLTDYQADRIEAGTTFGLILGNYRILDRLGAGGMGVVFRAEHIRMRRQVAIKVLPFGPEHDQRLLRRFLTEIRAIAQLQHPNIVGAFDAGECAGADGQVLHFFVMEYVPGMDLEELVRQQGPVSPLRACDLMHQLASALVEAHKHNLVHRDIKPSNIQITAEGQAKLLDFGLARHYHAGGTEPGTLLGTLDYMAPEQVQDASSVDIRGDIYGLGGVLYWCLTGAAPFPAKGNMVQDLASRLNQQPPSVRTKRPELSPEIDGLIRRMMALQPDDRFPTPRALMKALLPFLREASQDCMVLTDSNRTEAPRMDIATSIKLPTNSHVHQVLIVDDEASIRTFSRYILQSDGLQCDEAPGGKRAMEMTRQKSYDLMLLDIHMPDLNGSEVCRLLRENPPSPHLKIIMVSGGTNTDDMSKLLLGGADDFITKPYSVVQLQARVRTALRLKEAQDRADVLNRHLLSLNQELEKSLSTRDSDLLAARNALVLAMAKLVEQRACETPSHLVRMQRYSRCLAEEAARGGKVQIDSAFIELLECCVPLHDVGKMALPDHILSKPGKLDTDERLIMQAHAQIGGDTLAEVAKSQPAQSVAFLHMAADIARHHHERFDGTGYPDRLAGEAIPIAARIVAIADVYDALRCRRVYKPGLSHNAAVQVILEVNQGQFDPSLLQVFTRVAGQFERIFQEQPE
jgi:response regulator RpfG family c-di-GMP phosphodiesterase